ncbi:MAG: hypothetical protein ABI769_10065 [Pseudomonadota bacterium]
MLATLFAVMAHGREPDVSGLKSYAMPEYTIVTHDKGAARQIPMQIAMIDSALRKVLSGPRRIAGAPTYVVIARLGLWKGYLEPGPEYVGEFIPGRFVNYILINDCGCGEGGLRGTIYYEYTHQFLHTQFRGILPLWFDEGMAGLMQTTVFVGSKAMVGQRPFIALWSQDVAPGWTPLRRLLDLEKSSPEYRSIVGWETGLETWGLVHRGIVADPAYGKQMFDYLDALNDVSSIDDAVKASFGISVEELNTATYHYLRNGPFNVRRIEIDLPKPIALNPGRSMSELESLQLVADAMLVSGFNPEHVVEVINAAQRRAPDSAEVIVLRMRLAARDRADANLLQLLREMEPHLAKPAFARGAGLALFERVQDERSDDSMNPDQRLELQQRALELLDKALRAQPDDPEAAWAFGILAASSKQMLGSALQRLLSASESAPMNSDLAMASALVYEAMQKPMKMIAALEDASRYSRSAEQRKRARQRIEELKKSGLGQPAN